MEARWTTLLVASVLAAAVTLSGCEGDDGDDGAPGAAGADGAAGVACWDLNENGVGDLPDEDLNGDGVVDVLDCNALANETAAAIQQAKPESCATCHAGAGEDHQSIYDQYVDESDLTLAFTTNDVTAVDNGDGTYDFSLVFNITKAGQPLDAAAFDDLPQKRFFVTQYFPVTETFGPVAPGPGWCSLGNLAATGNPGEFTGGPTTCPVEGLLTDWFVYGYIADTPLVQHEGGTGAEIPAGSHVHLYDNVANTAVAFGAADASDPNAYESPANVAGCARCHGTPYYKHGYRAAEVEPLSDFAACKSCHRDERDGGHFEWQWMVDDPFAWATNAVGPDEEAKYAYKSTVMNDTHMAHAMEFPYPQSMSNCVVCHDGKLDVALAAENFTAETCKSCHPVDGVDAWPGDVDDPGSQYYQAHRAPPMTYIWTEAEVADFHNMTLDCTICHTDGSGIGFSDLHSGYDDHVYDADGNRYADNFTVSIDGVSADLGADTMTVTFSASDADITPEVLVSFYGWDTRQFIVPSHAYDASANCPGGRRDNCRYEWDPGQGTDNPLFPALAGTGTAGDPWVLTVDLAAWVPGASNDGDATGQPNVSIPELIADGIVTKAEVTVLGELDVDGDGGADVGLDAVTQTFDLGANGSVDNYFKGTSALVDETKCNVCHEKLGFTFHGTLGVGGDIVSCRNCHNPTFTGSHLEMASRSIENYVHTIHSFQDFDTDDTFNGGVSDQVPGWDPVYSKRYDQHIKHVFPNFTIRNCEACHVTTPANPVTYNVPDQAKAMPGVLSTSYALDTWYGLYPDGDPLEGLAFEDPEGRDIPNTVPEYVTGPASRACGACHRARLINQDEANDLASWNSHTLTNGTYVENDPDDDDVVFGVIDKIMTMFE